MMIMMMVAAAIIVVGVAAAVKWRTRTVALLFKAGYAVGFAWTALRSFGEWLLDNIKQPFE